MAGELAEIFVSGVRCDFAQYIGDYRDLVVAWNALAHDADNNRYRHTSIQTKVKVVESARARALGGDWQLVAKSLLAIYGNSKNGNGIPLDKHSKVSPRGIVGSHQRAIRLSAGVRD